MTEMYKILGWIGWIWLAVFVPLLVGGLLVQRARRRRESARGFEVKVNEHDAKQS